MRMRRALLALVIIGLPVVMLAPVWRLGGLGAGEDDLLYYLPSRTFFQQTIGAGEWPWVNPWTGLDRPFAADPQSALWYPTTWLFAVLPAAPAYAASLWLHYSLAIWGMYRLLRSGGLERRAALFGGALFAFSGFMLAHRAHFSLQHAAAWTPWVFWLIGRFVQSSGGWRLVAASVVTALQLYAGHVQIAAITALGSLVYVLAGGARRAGAGGPRRPVAILRWLAVWLVAGGLFAMQLVPTCVWLRQCTRVERSYRDFVENSWYPWSAVGWVAPMIFGQRTPNFFDQPYWGPSHQCEQFAYTGVVALVLAAAALRVGWRADRARRPWVVLLIFGLLLALGQFGPMCPVLYWIPGSSLFRVPARALLLFNMAVAALAAIAVHDLAAAHNPRRVRLRAVLAGWTTRPHVKGVLLAAIPVLAVGAVLLFLPQKWSGAGLRSLAPWKPAVWLPVVTAVASVAGLGFAVRRWAQPAWVWLPIVIGVFDLAIVGWTIDVPAGPRSPAEVLQPPDPAWTEPVRESGERLWVVTDTAGIYCNPLGKLAANCNGLLGIAALSDYGPLQPRSLQPRFGFMPWGVSEKAAELLADTRWMRAFNVGWVLVCGPAEMQVAGCDEQEFGPTGWRLYHNPSAAGMAMMEDPTRPASVVCRERSNSRFEVMVDTWPMGEAKKGRSKAAAASEGPRVVISRLALPGWTAWVDGRPAGIETAYGGLMAVRVPWGGPVRIDFKYFPPGLFEGAVLTGITAAALLIAAVPAGGRRRARVSAERDSAVVGAA